MASGPLTVKLQINADGSAAIVGLNKVKGALDATGQEAKAASGGFKALSSSLQGLALTAGAALSVGALAQSFITANLESQRLAKGLTAVAGSATAGAAEMAYISQTADKLGLSLTATGSAYVSLTAATKGTALEGDKTRQIFESVSLAMGKLGKSSADTQGALTAIEQMISKGKVSAEELRGQLGERLPGAFKLAAEAMGVTTAELDEMLTKGEVLATDLLPALSQKLNALYDDGQAVGGLEAEWNKLTNALGRMMAAADNASSATSGLGSVLQWATGLAASFATSLNATANARAGLGFQTFADDSSQLVAAMQARAQALDDYVKARKRADEYKDDNNFGPSMEADAAAALKRFQDLSVQANNLRAGLDAAAVAQDALNQKQAAGVGDDMVARWEAHNAAIATNAAELAKLNGKYDASIAKKAEYAKMEAALTEAVKLGTLSEAERTTKLAAFAAAQDKATESSRSRAKALSAEAQTVAAVEQKYGLMKGQLDAVWQMESSRGKGAGVGTKEWVKDLGRGHGHMTLLVGQFRMAESTAKGLGANMTTFNGQADAAGKYLAEAAAKGKTLWEQFAYYHGGPNEKNWGEQTRAYADAAVKLVADTLGTQRDIGQNTGQVITDSLNRANAAVQSMIQRYLPAESAAMAYAEAQQYLANSSIFASLSQEKQAIILQGLQQDLEKSKVKATETADAWAEVWKNAVKRIDDTFANLWQDLFSGAKSTLDSLKKAISSWLAEVAHALLTKPLVVAITAGTAGAPGTAGATGTVANAASGASSLGGLGNLASGLSSLFNWGGSALSSIFSGAVFSGISNGFSMAMANIGASNFFGAFGANMSLASSSFSTGAIGTAIGAAAPYLLAALPIAAIAYGIFAKYQKDQEPRYGAYAATTHGGTGQFEDSVGVPGGFGLTFGMNDKGSANIDAEESRAVFEGFAKMSEALAQFYGGDVAAEVEATLKQISNEHYARTGILNYAMDVNEAFDVAFTQIIDAAAATGDSVAVVMKAVVGDLSGTAESMAKQIETAMQTTTAVITMAKSLEGTDAGKILELGDDLTANALRLVDYARHAQGAGETIAQALARMSLNLTGLSTALDLSGQTVAATGQAYIDLARDLAHNADAAGIGMAGLLQLQSFYFEQFVGAQDKFKRTIDATAQAIADGLTSLGQTLVITDRAAFTDLITSLDLTTYSGRQLYVALMQLAPAFDVLFDSLEAFKEWLAPADQVSAALASLTQLFGGWGLSLPKTRAELEQLVASGGLTTEQMAILGGYLDALKLVFDDLGGAAEAAAAPLIDLTDLHIRLATARGDEATALRLQREQELAEASNDAARALLLMIWAAEDLEQQVGKLAAATVPFRMIPVVPRGTPPAADTEQLVALARLMGAGWTAFDPDRNNLITADELAAALVPLASNEEIGKLLAALDRNGDGTLSVLEQLPLLIAANIAPLFDKFDQDANGQLSLEELRQALGGVVSEEQLQAIYALLDINGDGLIDKLEAVRLSLYTSLRDVVSGLDANNDDLLSQEELLKGFGTLSPERQTEVKAWLEKVYGLLDANGDGLLSAVEALPLSLAAGLAKNFDLLDSNKNKVLDLDELKKGYGDLATAEQLEQLLKLGDANGDGFINAQEAANIKLDLIALKADKLSDVVQAINDEAVAFAANLASQTAALAAALSTGFGVVVAALPHLCQPNPAYRAFSIS